MSQFTRMAYSRTQQSLGSRFVVGRPTDRGEGRGETVIDTTTETTPGKKWAIAGKKWA